MSLYDDVKKEVNMKVSREKLSDPDKEVLLERFQLARMRIEGIPEEVKEENKPCFDFFVSKAEYIDKVLVIYDSIQNDSTEGISLEDWKMINDELYHDILPESYSKSYSNPDYAEDRLGIYGQALGFISAELMSLPVYCFNDRLFDIVIILELFLELYGLFLLDHNPLLSNIEEAIYYYAFDYVEQVASERIEDMYVASENNALNIVMMEDLTDIRYLYKYGEYISDDEIELAQYLATLSRNEIDGIARTFTEGFRRGFEVTGVDFDPKLFVNIRYHIGQERIVRAAIRQFRGMGLKPVICPAAKNRLIRKGITKQGYESTSPNLQFEYDHRMDDGLFLDGRFVDRRVNATRAAYEKIADFIPEFAGPAVIETFGEKLFTPVSKDSIISYDEEKSALFTEMYRKMGIIGNEYLPGDQYSFTIIAFPLPSIGSHFTDIFAETIRLNNLDNEIYTKIQQEMIDVMDEADKVHVVGMNGNTTDIYVQLRELEDYDTQTQFENCVADVNIPLGEIFTSPVLEGTHGTLNVNGVYLNGLYYKNLTIEFEDGIVIDYSCDNYGGDIKSAKNYIKENILFNHETLPIGEFAIGTNTVAYTMARRFDILDRLPILIVEKTGPHFALGDTCYSHAEDKKVYNPDGKEIVSRDNSFSLLRDTEPEKAYFNCHTDITIPYNELGSLVAIMEDGEEVEIIKNGRFVLEGTTELNKALED